MADISTQIAAIMSAVYGEEVRGSIKDALNAINNDIGGWHNAFIDGFAFDTNLSHVYLCSTAAGTADKVINVYPEAWLNGGSFLIVQFENTNTADPEDLNLVIHDPHNVNPDITLPIMQGGDFLPSADCLKADRAYLFAHVNDSITTGYTFRWELIGDLNGTIDIPDAFDTVELLDSDGEVTYTIPVGADRTLRFRSRGIELSENRNGDIEVIAPSQFKQFTSGQTSVQANRDDDTLNLIAGDGVSIECSQVGKTVTISLVEDEIDRRDFTPADLGFEIFDDQGIRRQYVTSTSGGSYYRVKLEAKTGFMTVLIKNVQDYDISEYDFTLDYGTGDDGSLMNQLLAVAGIASNSFSSTALFAGNHYKVASNGTKKYSEINLNSDPSTQPKALLVSFYKDGASASEVLINGTVKINFKKYVVKKFKELQQEIRLLASDPTVEEIVEGGSENG